jgi:DMSO/TMAO reductase YedYZ molybdopterin-dependent catalytic subunit
MSPPFADPDRPPPGPFRATFWRSPLRGPWMTSFLGLALLIAIPVVALTGFLSNDAYAPRLGTNAVGRHLGPLDFYLFPWPTHPSWLYALTQGLHVTIGLAAFPILLAKLWSVIPKLWEWPPLRSPAHALERISLGFLVGGALFEFATGILDIQYAYLFKFFFTDAHYYGAWVLSAAFAFHVAVKLATMRSALAARGVLRPLRESFARTRPEPPEPVHSELIPVAPAAPTMSRRALLGTVGAGSLFLLVQGAGDSIGGPLRALSVLGPRDRFGSGPNGFAVNRTALAAQIGPEEVGASWALELRGAARTLQLSRAKLLALPQHTCELPIACVEGWSTTQRWTGVRVRDLAALVGMRGKLTLDTNSLEQNGVFASASLGSEEVADERTLLALKVNGADLSIDHGYPARIIGPALPGVHCTKWVAQMSFRPAQDR